MKAVKTIEDLQPNEDNPRNISAKAKKGLRKSLERFGDISGITFNKRTGRLVCGHQRVQELRGLGGEYRDGAIWVGDEKHAVRVVDWAEKLESEANVAANNGAIQGDWSDGIGDFLLDIQAGMSAEDFEGLGFDELANRLKLDMGNNNFDPGEIGGQGSLDSTKTAECPKCGHEFTA